MKQEFKFKLGQAVRSLSGYATGTIVGRGIMEHIEGHTIVTYMVLFDDKQMMMSEHILRGKED